MRSECHPMKKFSLDLLSFSLYFQHHIVHNYLNPKPIFHHLKFHKINKNIVFEIKKANIIEQIPFVSAKLWCSPQAIWTIFFVANFFANFGSGSIVSKSPWVVCPNELLPHVNNNLSRISICLLISWFSSFV